MVPWMKVSLFHVLCEKGLLPFLMFSVHERFRYLILQRLPTTPRHQVSCLQQANSSIGYRDALHQTHCCRWIPQQEADIRTLVWIRGSASWRRAFAGTASRGEEEDGSNSVQSELPGQGRSPHCPEKSGHPVKTHQFTDYFSPQGA